MTKASEIPTKAQQRKPKNIRNTVSTKSSKTRSAVSLSSQPHPKPKSKPAHGSTGPIVDRTKTKPKSKRLPRAKKPPVAVATNGSVDTSSTDKSLDLKWLDPAYSVRSAQAWLWLSFFLTFIFAYSVVLSIKAEELSEASPPHFAASVLAVAITVATWQKTRTKTAYTAMVGMLSAVGAVLFVWLFSVTVASDWLLGF